MSYRDPLEAAHARVAALEAELLDYRAGVDAASAEHRARLRAEGDLIVAQHEIQAARALHASELEAARTSHAQELEMLRTMHTQRQKSMEAEFAARLDIVERSLQARLEIAEARANATLNVSMTEASGETDALRQRLQALEAEAQELQEEVSVLSSFSLEAALHFYQQRVVHAEAQAKEADAERQRSKRHVQKVHADAQKSGTRTAVDMAQMDMALSLARAQFETADAHARHCAERLTQARAKLAACQSAGG